MGANIMNEVIAAFQVIGSQSPWLESILLSHGASQITTFDYIKIKSEHSQIEAVTPPDLMGKYLKGEKYDMMVTFSSLEHSGLGR